MNFGRLGKFFGKAGALFFLRDPFPEFVEPEVDTTPDAFVLTDLLVTETSTVYESNTITVNGITPGETVALTITGGDYAIGVLGGSFGAWASSATTVQAGDIVKVRTTSSASDSTSVNVVLTIGGVSDTWTVTTDAAVPVADTTPDAFTFTDQSDIQAGVVTESNEIQVLGTTHGAPVAMTITGGEYSVNSGAWSSAARNVVLGDLIKVRGTAVPAADPDEASVVFRSSFEAANGSTTVTDDSPTPHTPTVSGTGAQIRTSKFKFGASSYYNALSGANGKISIPDHADFEFAAGNFTLEGWFAWAATASSTAYLLTKDNTTGNQRSWQFFYSASADKLVLSLSADGVTYTQVAVETGTWVPVTNQWYHLVADFDGTTYRIYRDGVMVGSGTALVTAFNSTAPFCIGNNDNADAEFPGYIDEVRITNGAARYGSNNGYTVPAARYGRSSDTGSVAVALTVGGVSDTFTIATIATPSALDTTPTAFTFDPLVDVGFELQYESNTITVAGINTASPISVTGGEYSKNGGAYISTAGTVVVGDTVKVRVTSSALNSTTTTATLTIGGVSDGFDVTTAAVGNSAQSIILDTDIGGDVDDIVALGLLAKKHVAGLINLLAVVISTDSDADAGAARATLDHYDCDDVPVYAYQGTIATTFIDQYSTAVRDRFGTVGQSRTAFTDDLIGLRTLLAQVPNSSVKYLCIGGHTSASRLRTSPADGISALTGNQLVTNKITELYTIAGFFNPETGAIEYNLSRDPTASQDIADNWPTPVIWHGQEIGATVAVSPPFGANPHEDPIRYAWEAYDIAGGSWSSTEGKRQAWDPLLALYGSDSAHRTQYGFFRENATVSVSVAGVGTSSATAGNDDIVSKVASDATLAAEIEADLEELIGISYTNLVSKSNGFLTRTTAPIYTTPWTTFNGTVTYGFADPFGGTDAFKFTETTANGVHAVSAKEFWTVSATSYVGEFYAKMGTWRYVQISLGAGGFSTQRFANFDLQSGVVGTKGTGTTASWITPVPGQDGWYRIGMRGTATASAYSGGITIVSVPSASATRNQSFAGSTSNDFYFYGASLVAGVTTTQTYVSTMGAGSVAPPSSGTFDTLAGPTHPLFAPTSWPYYDISSSSLPIHADSASYTTEFVANIAEYYGHVGINYAQYTAPIYVVDDTVPNIYVAHRQNDGITIHSGLQAQMVAVPVPEYAQVSVGTDRQMTIYRPSTDECWELFNTKLQTDLTEPPYDLPILDPDGNVVKWVIRWGGRLQNMSTITPQFTKPYGQMASGIPVLAQMVLVHEMQTALATTGYGSLPHSVKFGYTPKTADWRRFSWPANRSDGGSTRTEPFRIMYGQRFRLPPTLDLDDYPSLHPIAKVIFRTLQKHGGVIADRGGLVTVAFENRQRWTSQGQPDPWAPIFNGTPSYDVFDGFPWSSVEWLPLDFGRPGTTYAGNTGY
jgi:hypothetical protein